MTDVRALLKQKRQEARIAHPLAAYTVAGVLRCVACDAPVAGAWDGHVGSKAHRLAAARLREADARRAEEARVARKRMADAGADAMDQDADGPTPKRQATPATAAAAAAATGFPADFFSDASRAGPLSAPDSDDDEAEDASAPPPTGVDAEFAAFQAFMNTSAPATADPTQSAFAHATVFAEPELVDAPEGIPASALGTAPPPEPEPEPELTEAQKRQLKAHDEAELVMDRLLEEERAQEEADARVTMLRARMDAMRRKREAAKRTKAG
jgi:zinc finger protein 830